MPHHGSDTAACRDSVHRYALSVLRYRCCCTGTAKQVLHASLLSVSAFWAVGPDAHTRKNAIIGTDAQSLCVLPVSACRSCHWILEQCKWPAALPGRIAQTQCPSQPRTRCSHWLPHVSFSLCCSSSYTLAAKAASCQASETAAGSHLLSATTCLSHQNRHHAQPAMMLIMMLHSLNNPPCIPLMPCSLTSCHAHTCFVCLCRSCMRQQQVVKSTL